jgi:hypothetical protein
MPLIFFNHNEFLALEWIQNDPKPHVYKHQQLLGQEIDFVNVEILGHANTIKKLELK